MNMNTNRLYISNLKKNHEEEALITQFFSQYGTVLEVFIPMSANKSYGIVTMSTVEEAEFALIQIIKNQQHSNLFEGIQAAKYDRPENPGKICRKKQELLQERESVYNLASQSNIVCQLPKTHLERLTNFLGGAENRVQIVGSRSKTASKDASLLFLKVAKDIVGFVEWLRNFWFVKQTLHRIYIIDGNLIVEGEIDTKLVPSIFTALSKVETSSTITVRLQTFPPRLQNKILNPILSQWESFAMKDKILLTPKNAMYALGIIQLVDDAQNEGMYCFGIQRLTDLTQPKATLTLSSIVKDVDEDISRAHWKLHEAFDRYGYDLPSGSDFIAIDCGASPGGWTKFLANNLHCKTVYSIDPGQLSPSVLKISSVKHLNMKIQDALPLLKSDLSSPVNVWVSDMNPKTLANQVDHFLSAYEQGVVGNGTFFVLTLKCVIGYSSSTFDRIAKEQMQRIDYITRDLQMLHLFVNRLSERTIIGYICK